MSLRVEDLDKKNKGEKPGIGQVLKNNKKVFIAIGGVVFLGLCYWGYTRIIKKKDALVKTITPTYTPPVVNNPIA